MNIYTLTIIYDESDTEIRFIEETIENDQGEITSMNYRDIERGTSMEDYTALGVIIRDTDAEA